MPFSVIQRDITTMAVDAIVNAANPFLKNGGGVCGAIFRAAGLKAMQEACDAIGYIEPGGAAITPGFALPARFVIHTPGPVWQGGGFSEEAILARCYDSSLALARGKGLYSVAFPLISAGIYGYPKAQAFAVAKRAIEAFLSQHEMAVTLALLTEVPI